LPKKRVKRKKPFSREKPPFEAIKRRRSIIGEDYHQLHEPHISEDHNLVSLKHCPLKRVLYFYF
jgi:hypothetical protein